MKLSPGEPGLDRRPLGQQIAERLRHEILFGALPAGSPLPQDEVCRRFGTSRMPARDAINILEMEGFVTRPNGKDAEVADITPADIRDAFEAQSHLHALAAARAAERYTVTELARLKETNRQMIEAARRGEIGAAARLNGSFHRQLNRMSHSTPVLAVLRPISAYIPDDFVEEAPDWAIRGAEEHEEIIRAMEARDTTTVRKMVSEHVLGVGEQLEKMLSAQTGPNPSPSPLHRNQENPTQ